MKAKVTLLSGDGIGPEICIEALKVLKIIEEKYDHDIEVKEALFGGIAIDEAGTPYPDETRLLCRESDAVLLGAVGGPKWSDPKSKTRPEKGLLDMRSDLGVYANIRHIKTYPQLIENSPIKNEYLKNVDIVFVRELIGGIYFGEKERNENDAMDVCQYTKKEIIRITKVAVELASLRGKKITSVDKANVMATSQLWRSVTSEFIESEYEDIELEHILVDAATMHLLSRPSDFDVILADNLFGDILTDEASMLTGSIGMIPSASLGDERFGVYEPIHGSAPDIQNQGIANPCGMILSLALMLRHSLKLEKEASAIEAAVNDTLNQGIYTADLSDEKTVDTATMGSAIASNIT